jgi:pseudaminic acid synthase
MTWSFASEFTIEGRPIGPNHPPLLVAEISGNHGGQLSQALELIDALADAGVEAVKLQTYTADMLTRPGLYTIEDPQSLWAKQDLYTLYEKAHTPWEWHAPLFARARLRGLLIFSTPFAPSAVDALETLACPVYKIASFENQDPFLLHRLARTDKPLIMSTGSTYPHEIEQSLYFLEKAGVKNLAMLLCTSAYPAPVEEAQLNTLALWKKLYPQPLGLSDHTLGYTVALGAVALGSCMVEKHVRLAEDTTSVDAAFSLDPDQVRDWIRSTNLLYKALGSPKCTLGRREIEGRHYRRSLYFARNIPAGHRITEADLVCLRPYLGMDPSRLPDVVGQILATPQAAYTPVQEDCFVWNTLRL